MRKIFKNKKNIFLIIAILIVGSYFIYKKFKKTDKEPSYVLGKVTRGNLEVSVSGTGNIISENEFNLKAKTSGEVVYVGVKNGDFVNSGQLIIKLDTEDIEKQIRDTQTAIQDAEIALQSAELSLSKLENQYSQTVRGDNYKKALNDGLTLLKNFYDFYPDYLKNIYDIYFKKDLDNYDNNIKYYEYYNKDFLGKSEKLEKEYDRIKNIYQQLSEKYRILNKDNNTELESLIKETYNFSILNYDFISQGIEMVRYLKEKIVLDNSTHEKQSIIDSHYSNLSTYLNNFDTYKKNFLNIVNQINSYYDIVNNYEFDKKSQELNIKQKENNLISLKNKLVDLEEKLKDYYVYAPFSGRIANFDVKVGDLINSGTILGVLIGNQKIAEISLSEVDIANVKIGQKAILTFDALPDTKIEGEVIEINPLAETEQGVVNYKLKIALKNNNEKIKVGMSVEAEIITDKKENVILVPNSAIKQDKEGKYVEVVLLDKRENLTNSSFDKSSNIRKIRKLNNQKDGLIYFNFNKDKEVKLQPSQISKKYIKTGLSNNELTEVLEGLSKGEVIILRAINPSQNTKTQQRNLFTPQFRFGQPRR